MQVIDVGHLDREATMSAQEDKDIQEMMAQNRKGKIMYGVIALVAIVLTVIAAMSYFGSVAATP